MTNNNPLYLYLVDVARRLKVGALSPFALTQAMLERIAVFDGRLKSYAVVTSDPAMKQGHEAAAEIKRGFYRGLLHGVPIGVQDLCSVETHGEGSPAARGARFPTRYRLAQAASTGLKDKLRTAPCA